MVIVQPTSRQLRPVALRKASRSGQDAANRTRPLSCLASATDSISSTGDGQQIGLFAWAVRAVRWILGTVGRHRTPLSRDGGTAVGHARQPLPTAAGGLRRQTFRSNADVGCVFGRGTHA